MCNHLKSQHDCSLLKSLRDKRNCRNCKCYNFIRNDEPNLITVLALTIQSFLVGMATNGIFILQSLGALNEPYIEFLVFLGLAVLISLVFIYAREFFVIKKRRMEFL